MTNTVFSSQVFSSNPLFKQKKENESDITQLR